MEKILLLIVGVGLIYTIGEMIYNFITGKTID